MFHSVPVYMLEDLFLNIALYRETHFVDSEVDRRLCMYVYTCMRVGYNNICTKMIYNYEYSAVAEF